MNPKISVIIAVYNAEPYLGQCMDSVVRQTFRDTEILCINDGSTDGSLGILEEYARDDDRIRIFTKENEGLGGASARNYGLDRARGEYVIVLDSDDFFEPDMLEKAYALAEKNRTDIVVMGGDEYDEAAGQFREVHSILNQAVIPEKEVFSYADCAKDIFLLSQGMAWNKLIRRDFIEQYGLRFQPIRYTDDVYFTFRAMVLAERISVLNRGMCHYRVNSGTNQTSGIAKYPDSAYLPYLKIKEFLQEQGIYGAVEQSFVNCVAVFIRYCYDSIDSYEAFVWLHEKLQEKVFGSLGILGRDRDYFYDPLAYEWVRQVVEHSPGELAFLSARAHGGGTTRILRDRTGTRA